MGNRWIVYILIQASCVVLASETNNRKIAPNINSNANLIQEWKKVDSKIRTLSAKETELMNEKLNLELALNETTENIKVLTELISTKRDLILSQIRYLSQDSGSDLLRNLFESNNPGELERNHRIFSIATQLNIDNVKQYNRDIIKLENERQSHSLRISKLNEIHRSLQNQSETFMGELKLKGEILGKIRRRLKTNSKMWTQELQNALKNNDREKTSLYQSLLNKSLLDRKGQLTSPVEGNVKHNFGLVKLNPVAPALPFQGILFDSEPGTSVRAMADGTLAWAGTIPEWGFTVILDHGRDLHTVYSRVQLAKFNIGDMIEEGTVLGKVANNRGAFGSGFYFEVREGHLPSDPLRWILTKSELFNKEPVHWENVQ